jgi:hypothetical protein|eukprot:COSAG06_NODE_891_length_11731_cov_55.189907_7_plen_92_part_00
MCGNSYVIDSGTTHTSEITCAIYVPILRCMYVVSACCPCQLSLSTVRAAAGCWLLLLAGHCALGRSIQYSCQPDYYHVAFARVDEKVEKGR